MSRLSAIPRLPLGCPSAASRLSLGCLSAVSRHLDAGAPPRSSKVEVLLHREHPVVAERAYGGTRPGHVWDGQTRRRESRVAAERAVADEARGAGAEGAGQVERGEGAPLVDLGDKVAEGVRDARGARLRVSGAGWPELSEKGLRKARKSRGGDCKGGRHRAAGGAGAARACKRPGRMGVVEPRSHGTSGER